MNTICERVHMPRTTSWTLPGTIPNYNGLEDYKFWVNYYLHTVDVGMLHNVYKEGNFYFPDIYLTEGFADATHKLSRDRYLLESMRLIYVSTTLETTMIDTASSNKIYWYATTDAGIAYCLSTYGLLPSRGSYSHINLHENPFRACFFEATTMESTRELSLATQ